MSRGRIDRTHRGSQPTPDHSTLRRVDGSRREAQTGIDKVSTAPGPLFGRGETRRARHVSDKSPAAVAQLQLHGAKLDAVPATAPVTSDVAAGPATPVTPLRHAFDSLAPRAVKGDVRLLEHNVESWMGFWNSLSQAKGDIDASYFIFQRDIFGMAMLGQMLGKADHGQRVRLMLDAAGDSFGRRGFTLSTRGQDYLQELVNSGNAQVRVYHPLHKKFLSNLKSDVRPFAGVANNHDKLLRTEDRVITGGRNISKDYFTDPADRDDVYRDTDVLVKGREASKAFAAAFETEWSQDDLHFKVFADVIGNINRRDIELHGAAEMMQQWLHAPPASDAEKARLRSDKGYRKQVAEQLMDSALANLGARGVDREAGFWDRRNLRKLARELVSYAELRGAAHTYDPEAGLHRGQELKVIDRTSAAVRSADELTAALASLAAGARKRILIQNPYVVLTKGAIGALEAAGKRGVHIDLLTNSPDSTDSVMTQAFFLEDWPRILAKVPNMRVFVLTGEQKLHAKVATADDTVSVIGSYNLDLLSEQINGEIAMASHSRPLAGDVRASFDADLENPEHRVVEYTIQRDADGQAVLRNGDPVITFGPDDHMSTWNRAKYSALRFLIRQVRKLPSLEAISGVELP